MCRQFLKLLSLRRAWKFAKTIQKVQKRILQKSCPIQCVLRCEILDAMIKERFRNYANFARPGGDYLASGYSDSLAHERNGNHLPAATPKLWTRNSREGNVFAISAQCINARIFPNIWCNAKRYHTVCSVLSELSSVPISNGAVSYSLSYAKQNYITKYQRRSGVKDFCKVVYMYVSAILQACRRRHTTSWVARYEDCSTVRRCLATMCQYRNNTY
jgi:hypothetical protein